MRTIVYVDAFNLYFRLLHKQPECKWLNVRTLVERILNPANNVTAIKYYTADVSGRLDADAPRRQKIYFDALSTIPGLEIHKGMFLAQKKFAGLVYPPDFRPQYAMPQPWPDVVKVHKIEEKGSDVNLASHLLFDAFRDRYDVAVVISNDSDLVEPIRLVSQEMGKPVGLLSPVPSPNPQLQAAATFVRRIHHADLLASQFPNPVIMPDGTELTRPMTWVAAAAQVVQNLP